MDIHNLRILLSQGKSIYDLPLRVTYYARVSTDSEEQANSLSNQIMYFEDLIKSKSNWTFISGYVDEGLSGATVTKRERFLEMIKDASLGKFDLILTKEISRFSRNTLDSIKYTRDLLDHNVGVHFLSDNINTFMPDSELRLTIMSSIAQEEVRKLSERVKFGYQRSVEKGVVAGSNNIYGYLKNKGKLIIDESEADIIRKIFEHYVYDNIGTTKLSILLYNKYGYTNSKGNPIHASNIRNIIRNPKYKGYYCAGKTVKLDYRSNKRKELSKSDWVIYKDHDTVPPIVSEELWDKANDILKKRGNKHSNKDRSVYTRRYPFSAKFYCAHDNSVYVRGNYKLKNGKRIYWCCDNYRKYGVIKSKGCNSPLLYEDELINIFKPIVKNIINDGDSIINDILLLLNEASDNNDYSKEKEKRFKNIKMLEQQKEELFDMRMKQEITSKEFTEFKNKIDGKIENETKKTKEIKKLEESIKSSVKSTSSLKESINNILYSDESVFEIASTLFEKIFVEVDNDGVGKKAILHIQLKLQGSSRENINLPQFFSLMRGDKRFCCPKW